MNMMTTKEWLIANLIKNNREDAIVRNGITWNSFAGFTSCGCVFAIYESDNKYCVHSSDVWKENEPPNMGYYDKQLTYDELIDKIADTYDSIRKGIKIM